MLGKEALIIARLKDRTISKVADLATTIASSAAIVGTVDLPALCPAVIVHPGPAPQYEADIKAKSYSETQAWTVSVLVALRGKDGMDETYDQHASALLLQVLACLAGWTPDEVTLPMTYSGRDAPEIQPGFAEFALNFEIVNTFQVA